MTRRFDEERYYVASQRQLIWRKLKQHKVAVFSFWVLGTLYLVAIFCEFISPYTALERFPDYVNAPPQAIRFYSPDGGFQAPFVHDIRKEIDSETFRVRYVTDAAVKFPVRLFSTGSEYKLWGMWRTDVHLFTAGEGPLFLFGTDPLGRDLFTRTMYGSRISLSIGLVGVFLSFVIGLALGGLSGFFGGTVDNLIQRSIEFLISIPRIPLWMALAAALPIDWPVTKRYLLITIILSVIGWGALARVVRGKLLSLRNEDFVIAARISGVRQFRIITHHLLPSFASYIIVSVTLAIPEMILGETALSFLGLGMLPPAVSWGTLLKDAQKIVAVAQQPWLLLPCVFVVITVLMFNFVGDGLRDAADPYR